MRRPRWPQASCRLWRRATGVRLQYNATKFPSKSTTRTSSGGRPQRWNSDLPRAIRLRGAADCAIRYRASAAGFVYGIPPKDRLGRMTGAYRKLCRRGPGCASNRLSARRLLPAVKSRNQANGSSVSISSVHLHRQFPPARPAHSCELPARDSTDPAKARSPVPRGTAMPGPSAPDQARCSGIRPR